MNRDEMIEMLGAGYSPEYVSLQKWRDIRKLVMSGQIKITKHIRSRTCAMCEIYYDCVYCTMSKYFRSCNDPENVWIRVWDSTDNFSTMMHVTDMINHLQYLVAVYGKYRR